MTKALPEPAAYRQQFVRWRNSDTDLFVQMALRGNGHLYLLWQDEQGITV